MNLFGYEKKNDYFSVLMKLEIYDSVNKMKTKTIASEWGTINLEQMQFFLIKFKKIKNWNARIDFIRNKLKYKNWICIPRNHKTIRKITFVYMNYRKDRAGQWQPFAKESWTNPVKIIGTLKCCTKLFLRYKRCFVYVNKTDVPQKNDHI
jgi:hypothetical protein